MDVFLSRKKIKEKFAEQSNDPVGKTAGYTLGPPSVKVTIAPKSKALSSNPKDLLGSKKPSITKVPSVAILHETLAMMDGANKYGPYNWRDNAVVASIYIDACMRHLMQWFEGEEEAEDSQVHHLGHARACLGILLDALETGNLIDDRPVNERTTKVASRVIAELSKKIAQKAAKASAVDSKQ